MPERKSHSKVPRRPPEARIDDTLVRLHELREEMRKVLMAHDVEDMVVDEVRSLADRILAKGPLAVQSLFDLIFEDDPRFRRLVVIVLSEIKTPDVVEKAHELLSRPNVPEDVRLALLAIEALHTDTEDEDEMDPAIPDIPFDSLLNIAEGFWESMEMEEVSMMWCESFAGQPPENRLVMLEALMSSAHPKLLGVARVELGLGDVKIAQFLAEKLGEFGHPLATRTLNALLAHQDLVVRTLAERSLADQMEIQPNDEAAGIPDRFRFHGAYMATDECSGQFSVVYAVRTPDELIRFLVVLVDRWDRGIVDCWGNVRFDREQFRDLLSSMNSDFGELAHRRINKGTALTLINEAMELGEQRGHALPVEFFAWIHLVEGERYKRDPFVPQFGVDCSICHKPIRTGPNSTPWVIGDTVACQACTKRKIDCPNCRGSMKLTQCLISGEKSRHRNELRCPHCYRTLDLTRP